MRESAPLTPMLRQYRALKQQHPDAILLFRLGDFYEMFERDAERASALLELTLTSRGKGTAHVVPMCGFPHHQLDGYVARLVRANQRVAICEQVEDPRLSQGLVRREVIRMVTPGTLDDPTQLEAKEPLWVAAVGRAGGRVGAAFADHSTGDFQAWESTGEGSDAWAELADCLRAFAPRELVHPADLEWPSGFLGTHVPRALLAPRDAAAFAARNARERLERHFAVAALDGFGVAGRPAAIAAAGALVDYLSETQRSGLEHLVELRLHEPARGLLLDAATRRNLELERSLRDGARAGSLLHALDETVTGPGGRLWRAWLAAPLVDAGAIAARQDAVAELLERGDLRARARAALRGTQDVERLLARAVGGTATPRDLVGLRASLERVPEILRALGELRAPLTRRLLDRLDACPDVAALVAGALVDEPPASLRDGGAIRTGHDAELDGLRSATTDGRAWIAALEARERAETGIGSLKVRFNKVFGYYIEVSNPNLRHVPERYLRKQTIAGAERFITPELKEHETRVLHAQERIEALEAQLFAALRARIVVQAARLKALARALAELDVLAALAEAAARHDLRRPLVHATGGVLRIRGGRHPVVEQCLDDGGFVPNDSELEAGARAIAVLTGPNMGGKSTYLRQVALIALLAQCGSFVPAESAELAVVDRIFCRVGASDSLSEGQSTFMVEMTETAYILRHATARSLVLLDEIGRGTSTFDGLSLAWAVVEHLAQLPGGAPRTLFATHYHELTELAVELPTVLNLRMAVREYAGRVLFTHRVEAGASDRSYGIHVARLAGVPRAVIERAQQILANLERDEYGSDGQPRRARSGVSGKVTRRLGQGSLFHAPAPTPEDHAARELIEELRDRDLDRLTPVEALSLLAAWQRRLARETPAGER